MQSWARRGIVRRDARELTCEPWRIAVLVIVAIVHVAAVVVVGRPLSLPASPPPGATTRIQVVEIEPAAAVPPPPRVHRPRRNNPPGRSIQVDGIGPGGLRRLEAVDTDTRAGASPAIGGGRHSGDGGPAPAASFGPPPGSSSALRNPARVRLPGRADPIVEGFRVRTPPSIEDRVVGVAAMLFGGGRPETCDDVRQRLLGAGPGLARDMDVERLRRLCND